MESNSSASAESVMEKDSSKIPKKDEEVQEETKKDLNKKFGLRDFYQKRSYIFYFIFFRYRYYVIF